MAIRHSITLSTTEPNNEIGVIKIRQADEQTQTLEVQITENGVPKSYQGLAVYFCAKLGQTAGLGIIEQKLKPEEMTNPANGKLEYTMRAEDWQILGRQKGYFSFRKMKDEHEFVEQFTTRDFTFDVIKSVFSDGLKEVKKDGSTYVWTIEDMLRLFDEYIASGKTDWEEFVEQNREILESVDPGGKLIGELIDARRPFGSDAYATLGERLDSDKDEVTTQLTQMAHVNVMSNKFNVVGDGVADDIVAINSVFAYAKTNGMNTIYFPEGTYLIDGKSSVFWKHDGGIQIDFPCNVILHSDAIIKQKPTAEQGYNIFRIFDTHGVTIKGGRLEGDRSLHLGTDGEFGFGIFIIGSDNIVIEDVEIVEMWGDGIIQDSNVSHKLDCDNITIKNCKINNNRRNNITLCSGNHIIIENNVISNANGVAPKSGIDIEDSAGLGLSVNDIVISNNRFFGNVTSDIILADTVTKIFIQDNVFETNGSTINVTQETPKLEYANFNNNFITCTSMGLGSISLKALITDKLNIIGNKIKYFTNPNVSTISITSPVHNAVISKNEITDCLSGLVIKDSNDFVIESNVFKNLKTALQIQATEGQYVGGLIANNVFKTLTTGVVCTNIYKTNIVGNIFDGFNEAIILEDLEYSNISNNFFKGNPSSVAISSTYQYKSFKNSFLNNRFECDDTRMTAISILNSASINNVSNGNVARYKTTPFDIVTGNIEGVNFTL